MICAVSLLMKSWLQIQTELGLMGINVSCDYGGSELDTITYTIVAEEISRGRIIVKINTSTHNILYLYPIDDFSNNEQKERQITPFCNMYQRRRWNEYWML